MPRRARVRYAGVALHIIRLLVTPSETDSASLLMKHLGQRDVQYVNSNWTKKI